MALQAEYTTFTLDNMGRFLCNTLQEASDSTNVSVGGRTRGFDVIIVGGGTFGSVMAHKLFMDDKWRSHRILVLEEGPFVLPEHEQNMPFGAASPNWVVPWVPDPASQPALNFTGLINAVGGRSLKWGGWSPELLHNATDDEMHNWPATTIADLQSRYFLEASEQIGVNWSNDFIYGPLHTAMREQLAAGFASAAPPVNAMQPADLPDHPAIRIFQRDHGGALPTADQLRDWLGLPASSTMTVDEMRDLLKLEAPLAVQSVTDPGQFPFNKFSGVPLLTKAARVASGEADGVGAEPDARKRVMVVGGCHVVELITETKADNWVHVTGVRAVDKSGEHVIPLAANPEGGESVVIIALGTIETTRVALTTFQQSLAGRAAQRIGSNLIAHLRSNLTIRIPREALDVVVPDPLLKSLQVSAVFVKGKANIGGQPRYFHLQITASGLTKLGNDSEAELFKKIPDIDQLQAMKQSTDTHVVITIRGIGEMSPGNPDSRIELAKFDFDAAGRPKAFVTLGNANQDVAAGPLSGSAQTQNDARLWEEMDRCSDQIALLFANNMPFDILASANRTIHMPANATAANLKSAFPYKLRRDFLGTTHHEAGTMRQSDLPANGVTNEFGRVHDVSNCYVAGPMQFPTLGSPNPMLTSVALCRRTADMLTGSVLPKPPVLPLEPGFTALFDGTGKTFSQWQRVSPNDSNGFALIDGEIVTYGGGDFGLLYYAFKPFDDYTLKLQFRMFDPNNENSGVFIRFRDPLQDPTAVILGRMVANGDAGRPNKAWTAVHSGFEVQIDDNARPDGKRKHRTGAIYTIPAGDPGEPSWQNYNPPPPMVPGKWYEYEIAVHGNNIVVKMRNVDDNTPFVQTTQYTNTDADRGIASIGGQPVSYIGIQSYPFSPFAFRHIRIGP